MAELFADEARRGAEHPEAVDLIARMQDVAAPELIVAALLDLGWRPGPNVAANASACSLVDHIDDCPVCQQDGVRWCEQAAAWHSIHRHATTESSPSLLTDRLGGGGDSHEPPSS